MNDDSIQDLKQFISATVSQETQSIKDELQKDISSLDKKIENLLASVAKAIEVATKKQTSNCLITKKESSS